MLNDHNHRNIRFTRRTGTALLTILLLGGCATAANEGRVVSAQPLAPNRYMVTLSGSTEGVQGNAENNLLRRAAELTLRSGYTHFAIAQQDIESKTYYFPIGDTYLHGPAYGIRAGLWPEYPNVPETHYLTSAEVTMLMPGEAAGNPEAIDARSILARPRA